MITATWAKPGEHSLKSQAMGKSPGLLIAESKTFILLPPLDVNQELLN